jgi:hypothetical protein
LALQETQAMCREIFQQQNTMITANFTKWFPPLHNLPISWVTKSKLAFLTNNNNENWNDYFAGVSAFRNQRLKCNHSEYYFYRRMQILQDMCASEVLCLEHNFIRCWNLDASGSRSETPGKFWNVVLEEGGKDQLDWSCEKWRSIA